MSTNKLHTKCYISGTLSAVEMGCFAAVSRQARLISGDSGLMVCVVGYRWILGYHGVLLQEVTQKSLRILDIVIIISILSVQQVNAI